MLKKSIQRGRSKNRPTSHTSHKGSGRGCPLLRASDEHILIVRVLRAKRAPRRSLPHPFEAARSSSKEPRPAEAVRCASTDSRLSTPILFSPLLPGGGLETEGPGGGSGLDCARPTRGV